MGWDDGAVRHRDCLADVASRDARLQRSWPCLWNWGSPTPGSLEGKSVTNELANCGLHHKEIWTLGTGNRMARRGIAVVTAFRDRPSTADRWLGLLSSFMYFLVTGKAQR